MQSKVFLSQHYNLYNSFFVNNFFAGMERLPVNMEQLRVWRGEKHTNRSQNDLDTRPFALQQVQDLLFQGFCLFLYFSADEKFDGTYQTNVVVSDDGSCLYVPPGLFKSTCIIGTILFSYFLALKSGCFPRYNPQVQSSFHISLD